MIAKISTGTSLYGALAYNQEKVNEGVGKVLAANIICQPTDGLFRIGDCMKDFENWMPSHFRTENIVMHVSLNPHPDDVLTDEQFTAIGEEYMQKLGYGGQPYIIFKHEDIERRHIHIVSLRVDSNGKKIGDSFEHRRSKEITEELEQKYNLHPAEGQKQRGEEWQFTPVDSNKGDIKHQMGNVLKPLIKMYNFQTMGEFRALLSLYNIGIEEIRGEVKGTKYNGLIYSVLDKDGNKIGTPLKSSLFGKITGTESLQQRMEQSGIAAKTPKGKQAKSQCRSVVSAVIRSSTTEAEFKKELQTHNLDVIFRRNDNGRIYGVTFIDHTHRNVLNGSQLGKDFSANVFNDWLVNGKRPEIVTVSSEMENNHKSHASTPEAENHEWQPYTPYDNSDFGTDYTSQGNNSPGDFFSLFSPDASGTGVDGAIPQKKRKKKRKPGQQL